MFHSARTRLTLWYVIIVAIVSVSFSVLIYREISMELERGFRIAELRLTGLSYAAPTAKLMLFEKELAHAKSILFVRLTIINGIILALSGVAGYFLASKTLQPLELMVEEQKRFVDDASHELRTPLTTLRAEIEVALRDRKLAIRDAKKLLTSNLEEVDKMQNLINYLLYLTRYEKNKAQLPKEVVDIATIISDVVTQRSKLTKRKGITITTTVSTHKHKANKTSIEELFSILIDNAIKYTGKGGKIAVSAKQQNRRAIIQVMDNGIGISAKDLPHIFDRFYRADTSRTKNDIDGFGLGLSIAKSIIDAHGGEIRVKSKLGRGTTFTVILP